MKGQVRGGSHLGSIRLGRGARIGMLALGGAVALSAVPIRAEESRDPAFPQPTYADLAAISDSAPLVLEVAIRKTALVDPARAPDVKPGWGRLYVEATVLTALKGPPPALPIVSYLADVPLDAKGRPPVIKKAEALIFVRLAPGAAGAGPDMLQLVAPAAQLLWTPAIEDQVKSVIAQLAAPGAPGHITGVRELSFVPGDLAGSGETQIFLTTSNGQVASISVEHAAGTPPRWSVTFSDVADASGAPPPKDTLAWYRLACSLPDTPPPGANISDNDAAKTEADADYQVVKEGLGPCVHALR